MNKANVQHAINIMERVKLRGNQALDMGQWQGYVMRSQGVASFEETLHNCGSAACLGGWIAVSPEFRADGGRSTHDYGAPYYKGNSGSLAIAVWLDVYERMAGELCHTNEESTIYPRNNSQEITIDQVLHQLEHLLMTGELDYL